MNVYKDFYFLKYKPIKLKYHKTLLVGMNTYFLENVVRELSRIDGVTKILLYGSVSRGEPNPNDIDIAAILDDLMWALPLDLEGLPMGYKDDVNPIKRTLKLVTGIPMHLVTYRHSEFNRGISLDAGRKTPPDVLNEVGIVLYDSEARTPSRT